MDDYQTVINIINEFDALIAENRYLKSEVERLEFKSTHDNRPKLTDREAKDIRDAYKGGMAQVDLANNYGVNPATISRIVRGIYHR